MRIAVTDLTRMQPGYMCVAGVDVDTGAHVRPVVVGGRLGVDLLACHGGPFDLATVVDLMMTIPVATRPRVEDHAFKPGNATAFKPIDPALFWDMLGYLARSKLSTLFGDDLKDLGGGSAGVDPDRGIASLGCLRPARPPRLHVRRREGRPDQVRMEVEDGVFQLDLSVTDIRLYGPDHVTPDRDPVDRVRDAIGRGAGVLLSVGLTHLFTPSPDRPRVHWLQVNNVHLETDPCWRLRPHEDAAFP